jgi:hypothetical protein
MTEEKNIEENSENKALPFWVTELLKMVEEAQKSPKDPSAFGKKAP